MSQHKLVWGVYLFEARFATRRDCAALRVSVYAGEATQALVAQQVGGFRLSNAVETKAPTSKRTLSAENSTFERTSFQGSDH